MYAITLRNRQISSLARRDGGIDILQGKFQISSFSILPMILFVRVSVEVYVCVCACNFVSVHVFLHVPTSVRIFLYVVCVVFVVFLGLLDLKPTDSVLYLFLCLPYSTFNLPQLNCLKLIQVSKHTFKHINKFFTLMKKCFYRFFVHG